MMLRHIPGQVKANTWALLVFGGVVAYFTTGQFEKVGGVVLVAVGLYLSEQAAHLAQENHADMALTWIERQQQLYPGFFRYLGRGIFCLGIWMLTS